MPQRHTIMTSHQGNWSRSWYNVNVPENQANPVNSGDSIESEVIIENNNDDVLDEEIFNQTGELEQQKESVFLSRGSSWGTTVIVD